MNAEFNWWLLIVGVVGGAGLLWLVLSDWSRREEEVGEAERIRESAWIAEALRDEGKAVDPATAQAVLRLHRTWLRDTSAYDPLDDELVIAGDDVEPMATARPVEMATSVRVQQPTTEAAAAELRMGSQESWPASEPPAAPVSAWWDPPAMDRDRPERSAPPGDVN